MTSSRSQPTAEIDASGTLLTSTDGTVHVRVVIDVQTLAHLVAEHFKGDQQGLMGSAGVAALLGCSASRMLEQYATVPGFPKAIRLPAKSGGRSHPKWLRTDILRWVESLRPEARPRPGRPRKPVD